MSRCRVELCLNSSNVHEVDGCGWGPFDCELALLSMFWMSDTCMCG